MKIFNFFFSAQIIFILNTLIFQEFVFFLLIIPLYITAAVHVNHIDNWKYYAKTSQIFIENIFC